MRVRTWRFRSGGQVAPIGAALISNLTRSGVIGSDILSVVGCQPARSALHPSSSVPVSSFQRVCAHPRLVVRLLWPLLASQGISSVGSPQARSQSSPARPPHLPPRLNRWASLCCASLSCHVGLLCGSCTSAHRFPIAFLPPVGRPSGVGFW